MLPLSDSMNGRQIVVLYDPDDDHEHRERYCHPDDVQYGAEPSVFSEKPFHFIFYYDNLIFFLVSHPF